MPPFPRPTLVVSRCLELAACRYNAQTIRAPFIRRLEKHVRLAPVCPEEEIGLGTPRDPIRLVQIGGVSRLIQPSTERDLTTDMQTFAGTYLDGVREADGFILKSRSPSCGIKDTKVYATHGHSLGKGAGVFGEAVLEKFPHAAIEDEGRLTNARLRHHFLVKLYARAAFRTTRASGRMGSLVDFHTRHKLQLMANNQTAMRDAGRIVANAAGTGFAEVVDAYEAQLTRALARPARDRSNINVLQHALGYFSDRLTAGERRHFLETLDEYRADRVSLTAPLTVLRSWIARFDQQYLDTQTYFTPYPVELMELRDSGRT